MFQRTYEESGGTPLPRQRETFERLYDPTHPLRVALERLQTLDVVRIIEGKA